MFRFPKLLAAILVLFCLSSCAKKANFTVEKLKTEYLKNPLGLDNVHPRFTWKITSTDTLTIDTYHIIVGTDSLAVVNGEGNMWDAEERVSVNRAVYNGKPLEKNTTYYWSVSPSTKDGASHHSEVASFSIGLLQKQDWAGEWITDVEDIEVKPAPYFRKQINLKKKVKQATAYVTAAGLFEFYINGHKVGNHMMDPIYTRFDKRNLYVTFDVTDHFNEEDIALGVVLGNGWYNHQSTAVWNFHQAGWRARPKFLLNLELTYEDGSSETIATDSSWKTSLGGITFNSIYTAEHYNANLAQNGWNTVNFNDTSWKNAITVKAPSAQVVAQSLVPITVDKEITPVSIRKLNDTHYIFDLGRNISGVTRLKVKGQQGTEIRVTHSEQLDSLGNIDMSNINVHYRPHDDLDPFQTDIYKLSGQGEEVFSPKFNYKGFQYVEVKSSLPISLTKESITGLFMHSDVAAVGKMTSSNLTLNKIWEATNAAYLSNLFGYPTDCPQREKNGWTGDAHINIQTGLYNFDGITVYEKWMADHRDEQQANGVLPSIIPTWGGWGYDWGNGPDWTSTIAIIPWELYQFYGDDKALKDTYPNIKKYVDYITSISKGGLTDWGLGDWVPVKSVTPKEFTSSVYYFVDATILAKAAKHFGKEADYKKYSALAHTIKKAINKKYLNTATGVYGTGLQTELSAPLYWGIVPEDYKEKVASNLAARVEADDKHIDVGLLGTRTILGALSANGYADLAYEVASQETFPSWGWWIKNGATTLYENWDIEAASDISRNHIMFGTIGGWLYSGLGGILPDEDTPGFKHFVLQPHFVKGLDAFKVSYNSTYGKIVSSWVTKDVIVYEAIVPSNSTATIYLEGRKVTYNGKELQKNMDNRFAVELSAGTHHFEIQKEL